MRFAVVLLAFVFLCVAKVSAEDGVTVRLGAKDFIVTKSGTYKNKTITLAYISDSDTSFTLYVDGKAHHRRIDHRKVVRDSEYIAYLSSPYYQKLTAATGVSKKEAVLKCREAEESLYAEMSKKFTKSLKEGKTENYIANLPQQHADFSLLVEKTRWERGRLAVKCYSSPCFVTMVDSWHQGMGVETTFKEDFDRACDSLKDISAHFDANENIFNLVVVGENGIGFFSFGTEEKLHEMVEKEQQRLRGE